MLEKRGAEWGDKVLIMGVSIDQTAESVKKHVEEKKWQAVSHYHRAGSDADSVYGVQGVPHVVLVDTNGKIVYIGHPASRKLESDIDNLLKGETLGGKEGEAGGAEGADADGFS